MVKKIEQLFVGTCDRILIALLQEGECTNDVLAGHVGIHPVSLSRLLVWLEDNGLVFSRRIHGRGLKGGVKKLNKLTSKGNEIAESALNRIEILKRILPEREIKESKFWAKKS
jgi:DNA-binding MarR family transcriptional regulator